MNIVDEIRKLLGEQQNLLLTKVDEKILELRSLIPALDERLKTLETAATPRKAHLPGLEDEKQQFSFFRALYAIGSKDWSDAGFEKEVFDETRKRAMSAGTGSAGGYIVPSIYVAEIIELLRANSVLMALGATTLNDLQGTPVYIPKQTGGATGYWVGENIAVTGSDLTLGQLSLSPKKVGALVKLSNRLLKLSNPSAEALVRSDIAQTIALKIDLAGLRGTGSEYQPTGIANTASINTLAIGDNGGDLSWDNLIDIEYELAVDNALRGKLGYCFHPAIRRKILKLKVAQYSGDTGGQYIVAPISEQVFQNWLGYPYKMTTQIPINLTKGSGTALSEVYFGNWAELIIGNWGGMEIMASNETSDAFEKDQTWVRILQDVDVAVRHPESFCLCSDAKAT